MTSLTARPIVFTGDLDGWRAILEALGGIVLLERPGWVVWSLGSGRVALHDAEHSPHAPGHVLLGYEVSDLDTWIGSSPVAHEVEETDHGRAATVRVDDGQWFWVDQAAPELPASASEEADASTGATVLPIWYTPDAAMARNTLEAVGLRRRLTATDGVWSDLTCPGGGLSAVHEADQRHTELAFEHPGPVDRLHERMSGAGLDAHLLDEAYTRTLKIADPDGRAAITINEQFDPYGFSRG